MNLAEIIRKPDDRVLRAAQAPRVLMFSQRNIYEREVWRCSIREFEDVVQSLDSVELTAPSPARWYQTGKRAALRLGERVRRPINPGIPKKVLDKDYDIFFAVCEKPSELLNVNAVRGWKDRCKTSFCWLTEFYVKNLDTHRSLRGGFVPVRLCVLLLSTSGPFQARS
ncbi:MAG: hypothetical protein HC869_02655 [Rhodospirillales bacterium]|nr:hypothetical protein [Rhodospirillales bacterium]